MMRYIIDDKHDIKELMSSGDLKTTLAEVAMLINGIYCALAKSDAPAAEAFKHGMMGAMLPESPVWDKHDVSCISIVQRKDKESHEN